MFTKASVFSMLVMVVLLPYTAQANDYIPNAVSISTQVGTCWSLQNIAEYADQFFVVYDLSPEEGERMGVPWIVVQQGVCYNFSFADTESIYLFEKPVDEDIAALFSDTHKYPVTAQVSEVIGTIQVFEMLSTYEPYGNYGPAEGPFVPDMSDERRVFRFPLDNLYVTGWRLISNKSNALDSGIELHELLPLRYVPMDGFSNYVVHYNKDYPRDSFKSLFSIEGDVEDLVRTCDTRRSIRVPVKISSILATSVEDPRSSTPINDPAIDSEELYWDLASGITVVRPSDTLEAIEILGCTDTVRAYLKSRQGEIRSLEALLVNMAEKKPAEFVRRTDAEYAQLVAYAYGDKPYPVQVLDVSDKLAVPPYTQVITPVPTASGAPDAPVISGMNTKAASDTARAVEMGERASTSRSPYTYLVYFGLLPIIGGVGLGYLSLRRRTSVQVENAAEQDRHTDA